MNIKLIFLTIVTFFLNSLSELSCQDELNYIDIKCVKVNNQISIDSTEEELLKSFGKPNSIEKLFDELIDEKPTYRYKYGSSYFDIYDSKVSTFMVADSKFSVMDFYSGMELNKLMKKFPKSFASKYIYDEKFPDNNYVRILIGGDWNRESSILFKVNKDKVLSIEYWEEY